MKPYFIIKSAKGGGFQVFYVKKFKFFTGEAVLKPYITYAGLDEVYTFKDIDTAIKQLELEIIKNTERI
jgi:hypothetical protein